MNNEMVAYCGLICSECGAYLAKKNDDDEKRRELAEYWSEQFGEEIKPEDINCDGCTITYGEHIGYCYECKIRKCGMEMGVENCAYCDDYACDNLEQFFKEVPDARKNLEEIRKTL